MSSTIQSAWGIQKKNRRKKTTVGGGGNDNFSLLRFFFYFNNFFSKYLANQLLFNFVHASSLKVWCPIIHDPQPLLKLNIYASIYIYILSIHTIYVDFPTGEYNARQCNTTQTIQKCIQYRQYRKCGQCIKTIQTL